MILLDFLRNEVQSTLFIVESLVSRKLSTIARFPLFRKLLTKMHMGYQFSVEFNAEMKNEDNFDLIFLIYSKKAKNGF